MTLLELSKLAGRTLADLALRRLLGPAQVWTAIKGAGKYLTAAAAGDVAAPHVQNRRADTCDKCPMATYEGKEKVGVKAVYCGEAFTDKTGESDVSDRSCGCLVATVTIDERSVYPAGKTVVASESCPQGKWERSDPV